MAKRKNITTTQLALMTAAAVISLRGLPMMAQEELTMFFYIFFFNWSKGTYSHMQCYICYIYSFLSNLF